jgi:hypothetical protein
VIEAANAQLQVDSGASFVELGAPRVVLNRDPRAGRGRPVII